MSSLDEKMAAPVASSAGRARQTLKQLRTRWGAVDLKDNGQSQVLFHVSGMTFETWKRLEDGSRGEGSVYELEEN